MTNYEIIGCILFVLVVSLVSYYFGKSDGYRMGIMDAAGLMAISVERTMRAVDDIDEDENEGMGMRL